MIDKMKLKYKVNIPITVLNSGYWRKKNFIPEPKPNDNKRNKRYRSISSYTVINRHDRLCPKKSIPYYVYIGNRKVQITYWPESQNLYIIGRLVNFSKKSNKVTTIGDYYAKGYIDPGQYDYQYQPIPGSLNELFDEINLLLYQITGLNLNVLDFKPMNYELTIDLWSQYVSTYINMFNLVFKDRGDERYVNYAIKNDLSLGSSFYVKTATDYRANARRNYTANFYNKQDQLLYQQNQDQFTVHSKDIIAAQGILRLEAQCFGRFSRSIFNKHNKNYKERTLKDLLDPDFIGNVLKDMILSLLGTETTNDFYSYHAAKDKIDASDLPTKDKKKLYDYILKSCRNQLAGMKTYRILECQKLLAELGIHYFLIPKSMNVSYLPSIITLLDDHVDELKQQHTAASTMTATDDVMAEPAIKDNFNDYSPLYMNEAIKESASPINEVAEIMPKVKWSYIGQAPDQFLLSYSTRVRPRDPPTPTTRQSIYVFENYFADKAEYHIFGMYKNRHG